MLMKLAIPTIGVLTTVVLLASIGAIYAVSFESELSNESSGPSGAAYLVGNVKVTHLDKNGEVLGYRMGSNHITATGMAIIMGQVFHDVNSTLSILNNSGTVQWMEIGTGGEPFTYFNALRWNDTDIDTPVGGTCIRQDALIENTTFRASSAPIGWDKSPGTCHGNIFNQPAGTYCSAQMNVTAEAQFQGADCAINGIDEAGIFTTSTAESAGGEFGLMFARNTFGSVNLGPLDTLQLEWEFTFTDS